MWNGNPVLLYPLARPNNLFRDMQSDRIGIIGGICGMKNQAKYPLDVNVLLAAIWINHRGHSN
jgi:hypothetical protein